MRLTIATWNINSVRLREDLVSRMLREQEPDVLCLQETKCPNDNFPLAAFRKLGYEHIALHGQKGYHGVAVISRLPFAAHESRAFCGKEDARHLTVTLAREAGAAAGLRIHNFYVPAGGDLPDPSLNEKFAHKLSFLDEMAAWTEAEHRFGAPALLLGDLNIAPLECDVWSHNQLLDVVSHTPIECEKLTILKEAGHWVDPVRLHRPEPEKVYTWWSYRAKDWAATDRGRRLDHAWVSQALAPAVQSTKIIRETRDWTRPSDHVPVLIGLDL